MESRELGGWQGKNARGEGKICPGHEPLLSIYYCHSLKV